MFYRPLSNNYKFHISFKSIVNKTGEKQFKLNLSKTSLVDLCLNMQQFSQKVQKCNVISLDIKLLKVTCRAHLIAHKVWKIHHLWFVSIATFTL